MKKSILDLIRFSTKMNGTKLNQANQPKCSGCWASPVNIAEIMRINGE